MAAQSISDNARNWLKALSYAEGTTRNGEIRYDIMFGGGRFDDLSRHPDTVIDGGRYKSAAAGAYQFMPATWEGVARDLNLTNFGPDAQDQAALQLMRYRGVDPDTAPINAKNVALLAPEWASLPNLQGVSHYDQPVVSLSSVQEAGNAPVSFRRSAVRSPLVGTEQQPNPNSGANLVDPTANSGSSNLQTVLSALNVVGGKLNEMSDSSEAHKRGRALLNTPFSDESGSTTEQDLRTQVRGETGNFNKSVLGGSTDFLKEAITQGLSQALSAYQ